jgi:hypothetical protein
MLIFPLRRKAALTSLTGQNAKYSSRVNVFRFASKLRRRSVRSALRICDRYGHVASSISLQMKHYALDGSARTQRAKLISPFRRLPRTSLMSSTRWRSLEQNQMERPGCANTVRNTSAYVLDPMGNNIEAVCNK